MVHPLTTTMIVVVHPQLDHTVQELTESAHPVEADHLHTMNIMTEVMHEDHLPQETHIHLRQEDMRNHMTVGLLLLLEAMILTLVEILTLDPEVPLPLEAMVATAAPAVVEVMVVTMIDDTRQVRSDSKYETS